MDSPDERAVAAAYWRRQLQLCWMAGAACVAAAVATRLALGDFGHRPDNLPFVIAAVGAAVLGVLAVLALLVVHVWRVAAFTFRRGDS